MKLSNKLKDRYNILIILTIVMFLVLSFRLATLTIVEGDKYRDISDNKRLKQISTTAPRGEIRDRYGRLLAGNKPSFTVQIMKDELKDAGNEKKRNEVILKLVNLLEEDGVDYIDEFPIELNVFEYKDENTYFEENTDPLEKVLDTVVENNLLPTILDTYYEIEETQNSFQFITANRAIHALQNKGLDVPINVEVDPNKSVVFTFGTSKDIKKWKADNGFSEDIQAKEALIKLIDNDKNIIRKILEHPISREITFNILKERNLINNIEMVPYSLIYDEEYISQKRDLIRNINTITMDSNAKEDFVNIVLETTSGELFEKVIEKKDKKGNVSEKIVPGKILIEKLEEKGVDCPVTLNVNNEDNTVSYSFKNKNYNSQTTPLDTLIQAGKKSGVIADVITDKDVKSTAQEIILNNGINPKISISNWQYASMNNKKTWYERFKIPKNSSAQEAFDFLVNKFKIDKNLSKYEIRPMLLILDQLNKQGYMAYQPINIAYGIKDKTVAKIEEGKMELPGIKVSIEPVRFYPMGNTAAHILGYIGKISQSNEIKKYIDEEKYSPNDLIGKTGVEEKFEKELKGKDGIKKVEVDVLGNTTKIINEKKAIPGNNLYLTIDAKLQKVAEDSLKRGLEGIRQGGEFESKWGNYKFGTNKKTGRPYVNATSGAMVAIDVKTGEVLALANYPSYDPNLFATGISSADWASLFPENEEDLLAPRPLYNIAIQTAIQPGSTFKMITGLAALEKGLSPTKTIRDMGHVDIGTQSFGCWLWNSHRGTHGYENFYDALRDSCNYYFYTLTLGRNQKTGESIGVRIDIEDIMNMCNKFGLNDKTGIEIDIPNEAQGGVPNPQKKVLGTKALLKRYLNQNIKSYAKEGVKLEENDIKKIVSEITSWTELDEPLSRGEVIKRLDSMGLEPEKRLSGERSGLADKIKYDYLDQAVWNISDTLNISIGQGQNSYTPIQMANYIAILSNGGYKHKVSVVDKIKNYDNTSVIYEPDRQVERIKLNDYGHLEDVKIGMRKVTTEGTARSIFGNFPVSVGAKTGTAQNSVVNPVTGEKYDDYAWFVSFAPYDDPEIAVAVVLFQGGSGGYPGPIAREVIAEYLGLNNEEERQSLPFTNELAR